MYETDYIYVITHKYAVDKWRKLHNVDFVYNK